MINLTIQLDPVTGLYQFQMIHKSHLHWSRPMSMRQIERIARFFYQKSLKKGLPLDKPYYLASEDIIALLNKGAFQVQKIPPSSREIKPISKAERARREIRWNKAQKQSAMSVEDLLLELGL